MSFGNLFSSQIKLGFLAMFLMVVAGMLMHEPSVARNKEYDALKYNASFALTLEGRSDQNLSLFNGEEIFTFYAQRENKPYWLSSYKNAETLVEILEDSWTHGLNPQNYHLVKIKQYLNQSTNRSKTTLELLLTDAFVRYVQDMSGVRVDLSGLRADKDSWKKSLKSNEALEILHKTSSVHRILGSFVPKSKTYEVFRKELVKLVTEKSVQENSVHKVHFKGILRPGWGHKSIPLIRSKLNVEAQTGNPYLYDDRLAAAIIKFQRANGLLDDGVIGGNTLRILNRTKQDKIHQLIANMERLRWVSDEKPERYIIVNIPSATLWAIDDGKTALEMPVIVGSPARPTLSFVTHVEGVRLNPDWTIPATIKRYDILPKVKEDVAYLNNKGIALFDGYGPRSMSVDPSSVDWGNLSNADLRRIRFVQMPGDNNPLGRVRVLMPNKYNIYLHDTNKPEYFDGTARAISSGCVRMKDPLSVAHFIMSEEKGWDQSFVTDVLGTKQKTNVKAKKTMPVYILYYTAWVDHNGDVVYGNDIYRQDTKLIEKLKRQSAFYIPDYRNVNSLQFSAVRQKTVVN